MALNNIQLEYNNFVVNSVNAIIQTPSGKGLFENYNTDEAAKVYLYFNRRGRGNLD